MRRTKGITGSVAVFLGIALLGATTSAASSETAEGASAQEPSRELVVESDSMKITTDEEWVYYERSTTLPNSTLREVRGEPGSEDQKTPGEDVPDNLQSPLCNFSDEREMPEDNVAKGSVFISRQVALNLSESVMVLEEALVSQEDFVRFGLGGEDRVEGAEEFFEESIDDGGGLGPSATTKTRTLETRYEDPPDLDTSRARVHLSWNYTSSCVLSSWNHTTSYYWLSGSGWSKESSSTSSSRNCAEAKTWSYSEYKNSVFCKGLVAFLGFPYTLAWALLQPTTYNEYDTTKLTGKKGGAATKSWNSSKWGGCDSLLAHEDDYYYYYKS